MVKMRAKIKKSELTERKRLLEEYNLEPFQELNGFVGGLSKGNDGGNKHQYIFERDRSRLVKGERNKLRLNIEKYPLCPALRLVNYFNISEYILIKLFNRLFSLILIFIYISFVCCFYFG